MATAYAPDVANVYLGECDEKNCPGRGGLRRRVAAGRVRRRAELLFANGSGSRAGDRVPDQPDGGQLRLSRRGLRPVPGAQQRRDHPLPAHHDQSFPPRGVSRRAEPLRFVEHQPRQRDRAEAGRLTDLGRVPAGNEHAQNGRRARLERAARLRRGAGREPRRNPSALRPVSRFAATRRRPRARHDIRRYCERRIADCFTLDITAGNAASAHSPTIPGARGCDEITNPSFRGGARPASPEPMNPAANILANRCGHGFRGLSLWASRTTNFLWSSFPLSLANPDPHCKSQRGSRLDPIRNSSMARAHCRPSRIAHTTSDWPRRMSPAANNFGAEVR